MTGLQPVVYFKSILAFHVQVCSFLVRRLRNREFPWGIPGQSQKRQEKIDVANTIVRNALRMVRWILDRNVIVSFGNPSTPSCWHVPEILAWHDLSRLESVSMDYCQFAQPWRKRTRFAFSSFLNVLSLQRLCKGHKGICSRTGKPHVQLKGKCNGVNWTQIAEPYPRALCHRISQLVFMHYQLRVFAKHDKLCK